MPFDWGHPGPPPRPLRVAVLDGRSWVFMAGTIEVLAGTFEFVRHDTFAAAKAYIEGAAVFAGDADLALEGTSPPLALFQRLLVRPAAKKRWADLTEQTKRGYAGPMHRLGIRGDAAEARFHDEADSATLKWLRRHGPQPADLVIMAGRPRYLAHGDGSVGTAWGQRRR